MLHIWLPSQHSKLYVWLDKQAQWQAYDNWQLISEQVTEKKSCLYFPSRHILQINSDLTIGELKQLGDTGKKYLFEEISLTPVEQLEIRQIDMSGQQFLYALAKHEIEQWINSASLVGIDIQMMLPDFLLLPPPESNTGKIYLYQDAQTILLRESQVKGMSVSFLPLVLETIDWIEEVILLRTVNHHNVNHHNVYHNDDNDDDTQNILSSTLNDHQIPYSTIDTSLQPVVQTNRHPLNFLVKENKNRLSPYLKVSLIIGVLALIMQLMADGLSLKKYQQANKLTTKAIEKQFKSWFPDERLNTRTHLQTQIEPKLLTKAQGDLGSMSLFSRVSPLIKESSVVAKSVYIDDATGIKLQLIANNRKQFDTLINQLQQQGVTAQLGVVNKLKNSIQSEKTNSAQEKILGEVTINQPTIK